MIEELTLQEIESRLNWDLDEVNDACYTFWDDKCRLLSTYRKLLDCVSELKNNERYITDDDFVNRCIKNLIR